MVHYVNELITISVESKLCALRVLSKSRWELNQLCCYLNVTSTGFCCKTSSIRIVYDGFTLNDCATSYELTTTNTISKYLPVVFVIVSPIDLK